MKQIIMYVACAVIAIWIALFTLKGVEKLFHLDWSEYTISEQKRDIATYCFRIAGTNTTGYRDTELRVACAMILDGKEISQDIWNHISGNR